MPGGKKMSEEEKCFPGNPPYQWSLRKSAPWRDQTPGGPNEEFAEKNECGEGEKEPSLLPRTLAMPSTNNRTTVGCTQTPN